ncbi:MAG: sigma-70 family RNA polymerase sigma factor [Clostridium sp.]|nr:sigma-70 family RNA polymerase sigma factor [Clostridium sp.]MCM1399960.1 sigma-70 family RNA polymerase sigma factor [Clostridium sp.]MCM1460299.1 sigma-70 family RNA polymerase sigma factor [Bacteroides sp.]
MTNEEFEAALSLLAEGNKDGLKMIYDAYGKLIYAVVKDIVRHSEDAEDITSEFFIKLIRVAGSFQKGAPHKAWLVKIARNMAIDTIRKRKREIPVEQADMDDLDVGWDSSVENKTVLAEDMRTAMLALSYKERQIIDMKLLGGLKFREIATVTKLPMGTVTWLYNQGIKKLRRCLSGYEKE